MWYLKQDGVDELVINKLFVRLFVCLLVWANDLLLCPEFCSLAWGRWYHLSIVWISSIISLLVKPRIQTSPIGRCWFSQHIYWYIRVTKNPFKENLYIVQRHSFHYITIYHPLVKSRLFFPLGWHHIPDVFSPKTHRSIYRSNCWKMEQPPRDAVASPGVACLWASGFCGSTTSDIHNSLAMDQEPEYRATWFSGKRAGMPRKIPL